MTGPRHTGPASEAIQVLAHTQAYLVSLMISRILTRADAARLVEELAGLVRDMQTDDLGVDGKFASVVKSLVHEPMFGWAEALRSGGEVKLTVIDGGKAR